MDRGVFVSRTEAASTSQTEAWDRYLREITPTKKPSTVAREKNRVKTLAALPFARRSLASIKGSDITTFIWGRQAEGLGANAIRLDLALLSHVFTVTGSAWGMEPLGNPVKRIRGQRPKLPGGRTRRLVDDEHQRLVEAASKNQGGMPLMRHAGIGPGPCSPQCPQGWRRARAWTRSPRPHVGRTAHRAGLQGHRQKA